MRLRGFLWLTTLALVVEVVVVLYWLDRAAIDCWPQCDTGQTVSRWTIVIVPALVVAVLFVSVIRWLLSRRGRSGEGGARGA